MDSLFNVFKSGLSNFEWPKGHYKIAVVRAAPQICVQILVICKRYRKNFLFKFLQVGVMFSLE